MAWWLFESRRPSPPPLPPLTFSKSKYFTMFANTTTIAPPPPPYPPFPTPTLPPPFPPFSPPTPPPPSPAFEFPPLPPFPPFPDLPPFSASPPPPPPPPPEPLSPPDNTWPPPSQPQSQLVVVVLGCILALSVLTTIVTMSIYNSLQNPPQTQSNPNLSDREQIPTRLMPPPANRLPERHAEVAEYKGAGLDHTLTTIYSDW